MNAGRPRVALRLTAALSLLAVVPPSAVAAATGAATGCAGSIRLWTAP